jgi:hypothetical protein
MPRSIWKGAISFGLVTIPVKLFSATEEKDIRFHQVHRTDGGRIKYQRTCSVDGEVVSYDDIAKGYDIGGGEMVILTDEDFADLPLTTSRAIDVLQFVPAEDIDPILLFDPTTLPHRAREEPVEAAVRIARRVVELLQARDGEGYVLRVDLRLRPSPEVTPIALPVEAAISYYESQALPWERAAFIRARAATRISLPVRPGRISSMTMSCRALPFASAFRSPSGASVSPSRST